MAWWLQGRALRRALRGALAAGLLLAACGDEEDAADAETPRDAAAGRDDAQAGPGSDACIDVGEPFAAPYCAGDYCLEQPSLPLVRPLAVDGSGERDVWVLLPERGLLHRGCSGWTLLPDALGEDVRCVSSLDRDTCIDDDGDDCSPVCHLVVTGPRSAWLQSDALLRFDGEAFARFDDAPAGTSQVMKSATTSG